MITMRTLLLPQEGEAAKSCLDRLARLWRSPTRRQTGLARDNLNNRDLKDIGQSRPDFPRILGDRRT